MYSLDINFLKDRQSENSSTALKPTPVESSPIDSVILIGGLALLLLLPGAAFGYSLMLNDQNAKIQQEIDELDREIQKFQAQNEKIKQLQTQVNQEINQNKALISVFTQIKPWSAILEDIRDRIPGEVQINSIRQSTSSRQGSGIAPIVLTIEGIARSHDDANDFLLTLKKSKFFQASTLSLERTELIDNPFKLKYDGLPTGQLQEDQEPPIKLPQVVRYSITGKLNNIPASKLLQELNRKGAVGLINRIQTIENIERKRSY